MRHAALCATRNLYGDMETAAKSLVANGGADIVHFFVEDAEFPRDLPDCIEVHDVSGQLFFPPEGANTATRFTYMTLMRCVFHNLLLDVDKLLYLDCDTVCIADVKQIWDIDVSNAYFAATPENWARSRPGLVYCNVGVCMMNLANLRDCGKGDEIVDVLNAHRFEWPDQDALNYLCQGYIAHLPSGFNSCPWTVDDGSPERIVHFAARDDWRGDPRVREYRDMDWEEAVSRGTRAVHV